VTTTGFPTNHLDRARPARAFPVLVLGEVLFGLVTVATVLSLRRVFAGGEWLVPLLVHAVLAHATVAVLRRRQVPLGAALLGAFAVGAVTIAAVHAGEATTYGIPTPATLDALLTAVADAFGQFGDIKAPTEALDGFLIATAVAIWAGAIAGDWAAFRADAPLEGILPAASLFAIASVLGADVDRVLLAGVWIGTVLAFVLVRRAERIGRTSTWVGDQRHRGPRALVLLGVGLAVAATAAAALVGPRLPGAESEAVLSLTDLGDDDPGTRVTVSPLVDIRSRLVQQADVEVFRVRSDVRSYWRLTSLETFDGAIWKSNGSYGRASGDLDAGVPVASDRIVFDQRYEVAALAQIWLPAAYEPRAVRTDDPVRYDEVSGTLIVDSELPTSDGLTYVVRSALPQHQPDALAAASREAPAGLAATFLQLPDDLSPAVRDLAASIVAGSGSPYEAALRLQDHFRTGFTYDIAVDLAHDIDDLDTFLFEVRAGYCEQFAGAFAAMARSVGLPSRVAVGFTPGVADPSDPTLFRVRGEHAHAWPEVYLGEYGWVAFEPTPGRGAPFAEQYTGVPEQQAASGGDGSTATTVPEDAPVTDEAAPTTTAPDMSPPTFPEEAGSQVGTDAPAEERAPNPWPLRIALALAVVVAALATYLVGVLAAGAVRHALRRRRADTPVAQVALAWEESLDAARRAGVGVRRSATQSQAAAEIGRRIPDVEGDIAVLARSVEAAAFSPAPPDGAAGEQALALADRIGETTRATMAPADRFRTRFDPRVLRRR
jgi:transglutaminase-like putative cysteine protease